MYKYNQLSITERVKIFEALKRRCSIREIARELGRHFSTISRELARNSDFIGYLYPQEAHAKAQQRKAKNLRKIDKIPKLKAFMIAKLQVKWIPDAIAGAWNLENPSQKVTAETIYRYIYAQENKKLELWKLLSRTKKRRGISRKSYKRSKIVDRISIHERPKTIENRSEIGHFEADLFFQQGSMSANVLNCVERTSRKIFLVKHDSKLSKKIVKSIESAIGACAKTVTFDNGSEFAQHHELKKNGIQTYFCDPGSPWQKGSVENANRILRKFLPFKLSYKEITQEKLDQIAEIMNNTPRKSLNYLTPNQVFQQHYQNLSGVALHN